MQSWYLHCVKPPTTKCELFLLDLEVGDLAVVSGLKKERRHELP